MGAGVYNFEIEQGVDWSRVFTYKTAAGVAVDVTGYGARMKIRKSPDSANHLLHLNKNTGGTGGIAVGTTDGTFTVTITAAKSAALDFDTAVYDFEIINGTTVSRLLKGQVTLSKESTK